MFTGFLIAATVLMGLSAGVFYAFACAVMPGLRHCDDATFVASMRHINEAILNPWFFLAFIGAIPATVAALFAGSAAGAATWPIWVGLALHLVKFAITVGINVPLNNRLVADAPSGDPARIRDYFEAKWTRWHLIRTIFGTAGFVFLCVAFAVS